MKLIIHTGTGTIVDADDQVYVLDIDSLTPEERTKVLVEDNTQLAVKMAVMKGRRLTEDALSITPANSMIFTPMSIKYEVEMTEAFVSDDIADWVLNKATEDELWQISNTAISDDLLWRNYTDVLGGAIEQIYKKQVAK
jgi:hypothetical protein